MTRNESFRRKIIYIAAIALLLIPLSFISQPATIKKDGGESTVGGMLSQLRKQHGLSQAEISEINPASESMKLATLGLRPVAVTLLWGRVQDARKKEQWDRLRTSTQTLIALQPNFIKVWEFQAHNLSYNISREFDDYQYRYHWVKEGLSYLMQGIAYNRKDHRIFDQLGFFFGLKLGRADEKEQFRRLFRRDADYHNKLAEYGIDKKEIRSPDLGGPDNWLTSYQWYDISRRNVDEGIMALRTSEIMFFKNAPSQLRNFAIDYEIEKRPDDAAQVAWQKALDEWTGSAFGLRTIRTSANLPIQLERLVEEKRKLEDKRVELDKFFPGLRKKLDEERLSNMTDQMWEVYNTPTDEIVDPELYKVWNLAREIVEADRDTLFKAAVDAGLADGSLMLTEQQKLGYERLEMQMNGIRRELDFTSRYRGTVNYEYWSERATAESQDVTIDARKALYDARALVRQAKIDQQTVTKPKKDADDQFVLDQNGNQVMETVVDPGAVQKYEESFNLWKKVFIDFKGLEDDVMEDDLVAAMQEYYSNLKKIQVEWPLDFPLQRLVDRRHRMRMEDGLPSTESLADRIEAQKELEAVQKELQQGSDQENSDKPGVDPAKAEPAKAEPAKAEPAKAEPAKAEPAKAEPAKAESKKEN